MPLTSPDCPIDYAAKEWVEDSLHLLGSFFGNKTLAKQPVVEPTESFFPDPYAASLDGATMLLHRTAGFIGTDTNGIEVRIVPQRGELWLTDERDYDDAPSAPGSPYADNASPPAEPPPPNGMVFAIELDDLAVPEQLVGLFARELAGLRLVEDAGIDSHAYDFGPLADLTATFFGMGLFISAIPYVAPDDGSPTPLMLPPASLGWAMAHVAWHQNDTKPTWMSHLCSEARHVAKQGLRYLTTTQASDFPPR